MFLSQGCDDDWHSKRYENSKWHVRTLKVCNLYGDKDLRSVVATFDGVAPNQKQESAPETAFRRTAESSKTCERQVSQIRKVASDQACSRNARFTMR